MSKKLDYFHFSILVLAFLGTLSFVGAVVYLLFALHWPGVLLSIILSVAAFIPFVNLLRGDARETAGGNTDNKFYLFASAYLLSAVAGFVILYIHSTVKAVISPWEVVPGYFFAVYGLATLLLFTALAREARETYKLILLSLHYFLSFSVALLVYKLGYGYDPFVHEATLDIIDKAGFVEPKPLYYLGQYSLVIIFHKVLFIPVAWLNKILVPLLASIFIPVFAFKAIASRSGGEKNAILAVLSLLILPYSIFIMTTPQGLAFLFLLLVLLIGYGYPDRRSTLPLLYILSFSALLTQPIAGIPALIFSLILTLRRLDIRHKKYAYVFLYSSAALLLPLLFIAFDSGNAGSITAWSWQDFSPPTLVMPWRENFILNAVYLYGFNLKAVIALLIAAGGLVYLSRKEKDETAVLAALMSAALSVAYLITKNLSFDYLIEYERSDFPERILAAAVLFSLPLMIIALHSLISGSLRQQKFFRISAAVFLSALITASLYLSYPRIDRYFNTKGFSTGKNDIRAVHLINNGAQGDYIVLANQQVSAAALREFGFAKYYRGDIFYYPVPTSGRLYQYYLDMVYEKPSRATMREAMDFAGVNKGYFVLNRYWWAFPRVLDEAKLEADSWQEVGKGDIFIFEYSR